MEIGVPELLIVLVIVILVFGVGRVGQLGGELGKAIRSFREAVSGGSNDTPAAHLAAAPASTEPAPAVKPAEPEPAGQTDDPKRG